MLSLGFVMNFIKDLNAASRILFFIVGFIIMFAFVALRNNFYPYESEVFLRLIDVPFVLICTAFGLTSIRLLFAKQDDDNNKQTGKIDVVLALLGIIVILFVLIINLFFADKV